MNLIKKFIFITILFNFSVLNAKPVPESFADLADKLMPSVVNISTTQTVRTTTNQFPFQFPPGSPFGEMFKDFERPTERKASSLGSGFIINANGTVVTNTASITRGYKDGYSIIQTDGRGDSGGGDGGAGATGGNGGTSDSGGGGGSGYTDGSVTVVDANLGGGDENARVVLRIVT